MEKEMSNFDAFLALKDLDDEEIVIPASRHRKLKEGKSFDVRDSRAMEVAEKFHEEKTTGEVELEVYATDPITDNDIVNHKELVGQRLCKCGKCQAVRVIDINNLQDNGNNTYSIKEGDNTCPSCHNSDTTYTITGMVGEAPENKPEPTLDNDMEKPEVGFDNDEMTNSETEGEPVVPEEGSEEAPAEESKPEESSDESEGAWDETDAEDDTADMEDTTGDVIDSDDVKADDTESEEQFPWDDDQEPSEKEKVASDILFDEPEEKEKRESLNEELGMSYTCNELFDVIVEPSNIRELNVFDLEGNKLYSGQVRDYFNKIEFPWINSDVTVWDVAEGRLIMNVSSNPDDHGELVADVLESVDNATSPIDVFDTEMEEEIFSGDYDEVLEECGDMTFMSFDAPDVLNVCVDYEGEFSDEYEPSLTTDELASGQWYESLTKKVCEANGLRYYRAEKEGSQEYWIRESIRTKEDLSVIYENFVARSGNKNLINEFKELTGYRTVLDEMLADELTEGGSFKSDESSAQVKAKAQSIKDSCDVVYGYTTNGYFYELPEFYSVRDGKELQMATELVRAKYHPTGSVRVWYQRHNMDESKANTEVKSVTESKNLKSFKTRQELSEAIKECKNNNQPYKVTKSLTEGYRYDLLIESTEEDKEYIEGGKRFVEEIKTMSLEEIEDCLADYNFENNPPEDEVEEMIYKALKDRKAELEKPVDESLNEDKFSAIQKEVTITETLHNNSKVPLIHSFTDDLNDAMLKTKCFEDGDFLVASNEDGLIIIASETNDFSSAAYNLKQLADSYGYGLALQKKASKDGLTAESYYLVTTEREMVRIEPEEKTSVNTKQDQLLIRESNSFINEFGIPTVDPELEECMNESDTSDLAKRNSERAIELSRELEPYKIGLKKEERPDGSVESVPDFSNVPAAELDKVKKLYAEWEKITENPIKLSTVDEDLPIVPVETPEVEVIDAPVPNENAGTDIVPEGMRPEDVEIVQKLMRISTDTANAIHECYGIEADPRLILADMIQDLRLIGGAVRPEELANTPMNELTKEMYAQYDGFTNMIEDMFLGHRTSQAQRLQRAIGMLDSEEFSTPAIEQKIASDKFLTYAQRGAIPYINPQEIRRIG